MSKQLMIMTDCRFGDGMYDFWQAGSQVEADDAIADKLIKAGLAINLAKPPISAKEQAKLNKEAKKAAEAEAVNAQTEGGDLQEPSE